ncbi:class I SAM-dependent methyltransferase [Desulfonatronospira sp.]|uniref:class I SAM-dependent methyltransferase n=1 Tax=Desulfonatronospira sp. TaxID=1962951 RepID=UPI0025C1BF7F|nr:class I SAM-dependent methyltransferase [Desulfonatronospira sp.]
MSFSWPSYNELAWTEELLADPAEYEYEAGFYVDLIMRTARDDPPRTLLHLGSGAGIHDRVFKRHFTVTGVDLSPGMLKKARFDNPDVQYFQGDMRSIRLDRKFDAVAIPDSTDYLVTRKDLHQAVKTAAEHLRKGGVFLVTAKPKETFQNNNFAYTGEKNGLHLTLLENNYINPYRPDTYEAVFVYLIREQGELTIHTDHHILGLFPKWAWEQAFRDAGMDMQETLLDGVYERYILDGGSYPLTVFAGKKK